MAQGVPVKSGDVAKGTTGETGIGAYLLNWDGEVRPSRKIMEEYREQRVPELVWRHTQDLLDRAVCR